MGLSLWLILLILFSFKCHLFNIINFSIIHFLLHIFSGSDCSCYLILPWSYSHWSWSLSVSFVHYSLINMLALTMARDRVMKTWLFYFHCRVKPSKSNLCKPSPSDFVKILQLLNSQIQIQCDKPWFSSLGSNWTSLQSWSSGVNCIYTGFKLQADGALPCSAFLFLFVRKIMETKFMVKL